MDKAKIMTQISTASLLQDLSEGKNCLNLQGADKNSVRAVAIGNFDGFHKAHQKLFDALGEYGALIAVISDTAPKLTPPSTATKFCKIPIFYCNLANVKNLSGGEFLQILKQNFTNLEKIVVGDDFRFGKDRAYDTQFLRQNFSGETQIVPEFRIEGVGVHTSAIKEFLQNGECEKAAQFLGREYEIAGRVIAGQGLGAKELVATLNLDMGEFFVPKFGVYATLTQISEQIFPSVSFVGHRVSTDGKFALETHILGDFAQNLSPNFASVKFVKFIRN